MSSLKLQCLENTDGNVIFKVDSISGVYCNSTIASLNSTVGGLVSLGGISISNSTNASSVTQGGALTIDGGVSILKDTIIGGNLTVLGSQSIIQSQTLTVQDNIIVLNSVPTVNKDAGILLKREQTENDIGSGDVVSNVPAFSTIVESSTNSTIVFNTIASTINDAYANWYVKLTSGGGNNQVRYITSYTGSNRTAALNSIWSTNPSSNDTINLYNRLYAAQYYREIDDQYVLGYTTTDPGLSTITLADYANLSVNNITANGLYSTNASVNNSVFINSSIGTLNISTGISTASILNTGLISTSNLTASTSTISNAFFTNISTSTLYISTGISTASILNTGLISTANLTASMSTFPNALFTNISTGTLNVSTGVTSTNVLITTGSIGTLLNTSKLISIGSINTIGSFIISGASASINGSINNNRCLVVGSATQGAISVNNIGEARYHIYNGGLTREWLFGQKSNLDNNFTFTSMVSGVETDQATIDINGNLGVGTVQPASKLQVTNSGNLTSMIISTVTSGSTNKIEIGVAASSSQLSSSARAGDSIIRTHTGANLILQTSDTGIAHMIIVSSGSIGIGTTTPNSLLTVNGSFNATSSTISNSIFTNISTNSLTVSSGITSTQITTNTLIVSDTLNALSGTFGNLYITNGNIGINNTSPSYLFDIDGSAHISTDLTVDGSIYGSSNSSSQYAYLTLTATDEAINLSSGALVSFGGVSIVCSTNSLSITDGGALLVNGGASIGRDLYIGGNLYANGTNISTITGLTTIGSNSSTGTMILSNISIGQTMGNTSYKILGNLCTTTNNTNIYSVSFKNLTTTTFDALIYRIDALASGWTDSNLKLSWCIYQ